MRQDKKKKGIYLQMYETYWDTHIKQARTRCIKTFGYISELISEEIPDPVAHFKQYVREKELERRTAQEDETKPRAFEYNVEKNVGYFLVASLIDALEVKETIDLLSSVQRYQFSVYNMLVQLIYARIIEPRSKSKTVSSVFPLLYNHESMSDDQVYEGLFFGKRQI